MSPGPPCTYQETPQDTGFQQYREKTVYTACKARGLLTKASPSVCGPVPEMWAVPVFGRPSRMHGENQARWELDLNVACGTLGCPPRVCQALCLCAKTGPGSGARLETKSPQVLAPYRERRSSSGPAPGHIWQGMATPQGVAAASRLTWGIREHWTHSRWRLEEGRKALELEYCQATVGNISIQLSVQGRASWAILPVCRAPRYRAMLRCMQTSGFRRGSRTGIMLYRISDIRTLLIHRGISRGRHL